MHTTSTTALPPGTAAAMEHLRTQLRHKQADWQKGGQNGGPNEAQTPLKNEGPKAARETHIPVDRYFSTGQWQAEVKHLFRALPLIAAHSSELASGQVLAHDSYGMPLLLSRDANGQVRCFLNVCRHRGMRLVPASTLAQQRASVVCPYHGWTFQLNGQLRHMPHADAFSPCAKGERDLVALPCAERHGLIWVVPDPAGDLDLDTFLGDLNAEMPYLCVGELKHFRTVEADYPANWKLIIDAFSEAYHIRVLHKDTIYPFFTDGITSAQRFGPHIHSLVARRPAQEWADQEGSPLPESLQDLRRLVTPSQVIFPNTVTIFHPDYLSLITVYPTGAQTLRWTHRMLIPTDKATPDWTPHWEKTFKLIEQGVFQKEDIHCAIGIQQGLASGANTHITVGQAEQGVAWFHEQVQRHLKSEQNPGRTHAESSNPTPQ